MFLGLDWGRKSPSLDFILFIFFFIFLLHPGLCGSLDFRHRHRTVVEPILTPLCAEDRDAPGPPTEVQGDFAPLSGRHGLKGLSQGSLRAGRRAAMQTFGLDV